MPGERPQGECGLILDIELAGLAWAEIMRTLQEEETSFDQGRKVIGSPFRSYVRRSVGC